MTTTARKKNVSKTEVKEMATKVLKDPNQIGERFRLQYKVTNTKGPEAFGGYQLTTYVHPITKKKAVLLDVDDNPLIGYFVDSLNKILRKSDPNDSRVIQWLICHPRVKVVGLDLSEKILATKEKNTPVTLTNIDLSDIKEVDDEDLIDEVKGMLSTQDESKKISLERLRYLLAHFDLSYMDKRYVKNEVAEEKMLRKRLKSFIEGNVEKAKELKAAIEEIENYRVIYEIKEMLRFGLMNYNSAVGYKIDNIPCGFTINEVATYMKINQDVYAVQCKLLVSKQKEELNQY